LSAVTPFKEKRMEAFKLFKLGFITFMVAALTACGGGGGSSPAFTTQPSVVGTAPAAPTTPTVPTTPVVTPTVVTFTASTLCASGPALTSTVSQAAANALVPGNCPALPATAYAATSVVVGSGTLTLSVNNLPAGFTGGVLSASANVPSNQSVWNLVPTTTGNASATLRAGSAAPVFASTYTGVIEMNFAGAPSASKIITFTTGADPMMMTDLLNQVTRFIVPIGIQKVVPSTELPMTCLKVTDSCFLTAVMSGQALLIDLNPWVIPKNSHNSLLKSST
jgi:hypothetical protein